LLNYVGIFLERYIWVANSFLIKFKWITSASLQAPTTPNPKSPPTKASRPITLASRTVGFSLETNAATSPGMPSIIQKDHLDLRREWRRNLRNYWSCQVASGLLSCHEQKLPTNCHRYRLICPDHWQEPQRQSHQGRAWRVYHSIFLQSQQSRLNDMCRPILITQVIYHSNQIQLKRLSGRASYTPYRISQWSLKIVVIL